MNFRPADVNGINEAAFIMGTSGTSGPSKGRVYLLTLADLSLCGQSHVSPKICLGVCLSHAALLSETYTTNIQMFGNAVVYNSSPISWISGLITLLVSTICGALRIQSTQEPTLELELRLIEKYKVTYVENVPLDLMELLKGDLLPKYNLSSLKHLAVVGYKAPLSLLKEFNAHLPNGNVHNLYGMSELGDISIDFPTFSGKDTVGRLVSGQFL